MMIQRLFDKGAQKYDQTRCQFIPCFDDYYRTAVELIPYERDASIRVLDLGAGTGLFSALIAQAFPRAQITLVDISAEMLKKAQQRFSDELTRFDFCMMDYIKSPFEGKYEVVASALSIHHLDEMEKQLVFQKAYDVLCEGGIFINADQVMGESAEIDQHYRQVWLRQVRENGINDDQMAVAFERMKADKMSPLSWQLAYLKQIGYQMVNCWYKRYSFVVYSGRK